jgi:hypothetical protein
LLRPAKKKYAARTPLKKTIANAKIKPNPPNAKTGITVPKKAGHHSDDGTYWKLFAELCKYKDDHGPRTNASKNNTLAEWVHYTRKRCVIDKLPVQYLDALKTIEFQWAAGQIPKGDFDARFAELLEFKNTHGTVLFYGDDKKNFPNLAYWSFYAKYTAIKVLTNKGNTYVFTISRCNMLVDTCIVPNKFYLYGSEKINIQMKVMKNNITMVV